MTHKSLADQQVPQPADLTGADEQARKFNQQLREVALALTGWRIWHSSSGDLYATRNNDITEDEIAAGLEMTVAASSSVELVGLIKRQNKRADDIVRAAQAAASTP